MVVVSTGTFATRFNAFVAVVVGGRFFVAAGFVALMPARRTLDFAFFGVARFAAFFPAGLAFAFPRFKLFVRAETRFLALAMAVSCEVCRRQTNPEASELCCHFLSAIRHTISNKTQQPARSSSSMRFIDSRHQAQAMNAGV
jgi:hypothetical protein